MLEATLGSNLDNSSDATTVAGVVAKHADYWLRSAESFVRSLDPRGLGQEDFHAIDAAVIAATDGVAGWAMPDGSYELFRPYLRRTARPGPVVLVAVAATAEHVVEQLGTVAETSLRPSIRVAVAATAMHEAAHVLDFRLSGKRLPDGVTVEIARAAAAMPRAVADVAIVHGEAWLRALAHLTWRASSRPPVDYWSQVFTHDAERHYSGNATDFVDALLVELVATSANEPLLDVLERPAPKAFSQLIENRGRGRQEK